MTKRKAATGIDQTAASVTGEQNETAAQNMEAAQSDMFNEGALPPQPVEAPPEVVGFIPPQPLMPDTAETMVDPTPPAPVEIETRPCSLTMEAFLRAEMSEYPSQDFRLVARLSKAGDVEFYIHPAGRGGLTRNFSVMGDILSNVTRLAV